MQWLIERGRVPFLFLAGAITLLLGWQCLSLEVDRDNRSMDADNPDQKLLETRFREDFHEADSIFVAVSHPALLDRGGRDRIREMVEEFQGLDGIDRVVSLVDSDFDLSAPLSGLLLSEDRTVTGIRLLLGSFEDNGEQLERLIEQVRSIADRQAGDEFRVAVTGLPVQKYEVGHLVRRDQRIFAPLSLAILGGVLLLITRRFSGMVFPLLVSVITICWTLGIYAWLGHSLNMITSLLPPVIMTLSVATTIHIYLEWLRCAEEDNHRRITRAVRHLFKPCLFASVTTAIGFLSLNLSPTPAVRLFGIFAALGVGISFVFGVIGLAVGLSFLKPPPLNHFQATQGNSFLHRLLGKTANLSVEHPWKVILATCLVSAVGVFGLGKIEADTNLIHFLDRDSLLRSDTDFIDQHLAGVSTIELLVQKSDGEPLNSTAPIASLQRDLERLENVRKTVSIRDFLPGMAKSLEESGVPLAEIVAGADSSGYLSDEVDEARISVHTDSIGTGKGAVLIDRIRETATDLLGDDFTVHLLGDFYRFVIESNQLVASQVRSFVIAVILILIAIGIVFRSFTYLLLSIVPNVVPLLMMAAVMGFAGIALSAGTAMIASVVIGIAVDDTIHYLTAFRKAPGTDRVAALKHTTRSTGFVLLATTLALSSGFWTAVFGSFQPTIYFALLTGVTMWFALACDLLVLPALLRLLSSGKIEKVPSP